jgi:aspartyl-tRNA(Asn)/glutamyl-tRNA(Gln) amidotransferase subunit B
LPELPAARRTRYREQLGLSAYDAGLLAADPDAARLFEETLGADGSLDAKPVANWVVGDYLRLRNAATEPVTVVASQLAAIVRAVQDGSITRAHGREVLDEHASTGASTASIIANRGYRQISDLGALAAAVDRVLAEQPAAVADFHAGREQAIGFLVGQVMKATRGQANPALVQDAVRERLAAGTGERS